MRRHVFAFTLLAIFVMATTDTSAQGVPGFGVGAPAPAAAAPNPLMQALDTNKDGTISASELRKAVKSLKTLDRNGDGNLTPNELKPAAPAGAAGAKPAGRKPAGGAPGFGAGPAGGGAPVGGFRVPAGNPGFGNLGGRAGGGAGGGGGFNRPPGQGVPSQLTKIMGFDKNRDGMVTRKEVPKQLLPWFERIDLDRNGAITLKEIRLFEARGGR